METITAKEGYLLYNGAGMYAKEVIVPIGVVWEEVLDSGQLEPLEVEIVP